MKKSSLKGVMVIAGFAMISSLANADKVSTETALIDGPSAQLNQCGGTANAHTLRDGTVSVTVQNATKCETISGTDSNGMPVSTKGKDQNGMPVVGSSFQLSQNGNGTINFGNADARQFKVKVSHQANGPFDENAHDTVALVGGFTPPPPPPTSSAPTVTLYAGQWIYLPNSPCGPQAQAQIKPGRDAWILQIQQANGCNSFSEVDANGMRLSNSNHPITNGGGMAVLDGSFAAVRIYSPSGVSQKILVPQFGQ